MAGTVTRLGVVTNYSHYSYNYNCKDVIGNFPSGNSLDILKKDVSGSTITGQQGNNIASNAPTNFYTTFEDLLPGYSNDASVRNRLLAQTGPLTPKVNLPLFIFELRDLPQMWREAGNFLLKLRKKPTKLLSDKEAAAATLAYQFGWRPLIEDLMKACNFAELVRKKQQELDRAGSSKGLKRRIILDDTTATKVVTPTIFSSPTFSPKITYAQSRKVWATCRWKLRDNNKYGYKATWIEAFKTALGLNPGMLPISVWKALPWTWMIDWFTDISNVLIANYNSLYYRPTNGWFMQTLAVTATHPSYKNQDAILAPGTKTVVRKMRNVIPSISNASVTLRVPFLDSFKLSILGSMTILRIRGR